MQLDMPFISGCQPFVKKKMIKLIKKNKEPLDEEGAPANAAGGGAIAGIGVGPQGEPGVTTQKQNKNRRLNKKGAERRELELNLFRRKTMVAEENKDKEDVKDVENAVRTFVVEKGKFAGHDTFIVPSDIFHNARVEKKKGKHWTKYIGHDDYGKAIRQHARMHFAKPIILQDEKTGAMCYARYGKK